MKKNRLPICDFCGEFAENQCIDAIAHFGGSIGADLCNWCDAINNLLWELAFIKLQASVEIAKNQSPNQWAVGTMYKGEHNVTTIR